MNAPELPPPPDPPGGGAPAGRPAVTWPWWEAALVMAFGYFILGGIASLPVLAAFHAKPGAAGTGVLTATVSADLTTIGVLVLWLSRRHPTWRAALGLGLGRTAARDAWVGFGGGLAIALGANVLVAYVLNPLFRAATGRAVRLPQQVSSHLSAGGKVALVTAAVVAAPMMEELFFRGCLFRSIRDRRGFALAALVSSIVFGLFHLEAGPARDVVLLQTALMFVGLGFAGVYERRGRLLASAVAHATFNMVTVVSLLAVLK